MMTLETTAKLASEDPWCAIAALGLAFLYVVAVASAYGRWGTWKAHLFVSLPFALFWIVVCTWDSHANG